MAHDDVRDVRHSNGDEIESGLARNLGNLAREMRAETEIAPLWQRIAEAAVHEVSGAEHAGLSLVTRAGVITEAATDEVVIRLDQRQYELDEGPALSSLREQITVRSHDLRQETRWPRFAAAAMEAGICSTLSVRLFVAEDSLGVLNVYATKPNVFTDHDESAALLLAAHAAIAMKGVKIETNLRAAVESRDVIGQAKGILMERFKVDQAEAFQMLVAASQGTNRKLRDVAELLATTGELKID